jgi:Domain of unknown function (DUF4265)
MSGIKCWIRPEAVFEINGLKVTCYGSNLSNSVMNARYKTGDYWAQHTEPAWRQRANFIISADISDYPNKQEWEQLWARQINEYLFEICCIPFFVYDLALGDEVETDENYIMCHVVKPSGHYTYRAWFGESEDLSVCDKVITMLRKQHCAFEWSSKNLLAIDTAMDDVARAIADFLSELEREGQLQFETGRTV